MSLDLFFGMSATLQCRQEDTVDGTVTVISWTEYCIEFLSRWISYMFPHHILAFVFWFVLEKIHFVSCYDARQELYSLISVTDSPRTDGLCFPPTAVLEPTLH